MEKKSVKKYSKNSIKLHWITAAILPIHLVTSLVIPAHPREEYMDFYFAYTLGAFSIYIVVVLRLYTLLQHTRPQALYSDFPTKKMLLNGFYALVYSSLFIYGGLSCLLSMYLMEFFLLPADEIHLALQWTSSIILLSIVAHISGIILYSLKNGNKAFRRII